MVLTACFNVLPVGGNYVIANDSQNKQLFPLTGLTDWALIEDVFCEVGTEFLN
jgi:hypothetical protein